jgi:hypothetical protein
VAAGGFYFCALIVRQTALLFAGAYDFVIL